jgi:type III secretory pathway component EscU
MSKTLDNVNKYNNWTVASQNQNQTYAVDHCLSEIVEEVCEVQFALSLMVIVLLCNSVKLVCIMLATRSFSKPPLVVLGDAIASFLDKRDPMTAGLCLTRGLRPIPELHERGQDLQVIEIYRAKKRNWSDKQKVWNVVAKHTWVMALTL